MTILFCNSSLNAVFGLGFGDCVDHVVELDRFGGMSNVVSFCRMCRGDWLQLCFSLFPWFCKFLEELR